jgi:hypothetical protein
MGTGLFNSSPSLGFGWLGGRPAHAGHQDYDVKQGGRVAWFMATVGSGGVWGPNWDSIPEKSGKITGDKETETKKESAKLSL